MSVIIKITSTTDSKFIGETIEYKKGKPLLLQGEVFNADHVIINGDNYLIYNSNYIINAIKI